MNKIRLSDVADINKSTFKLDDTHQYIYYLDTANITKNTIATIQKLYPEKDIIPSRAKRAVSNNTIIYSSVRPNLCHFGILSNVPDNLVVSTGFITLDVIDNKVDPHYLYYLITTEEKLRYITNIANTSVSSYPSITPEILSNMEIEIINDIDVQKRISSLLKSIDDKIELNNKINAELETMAKTIYDYWFLQFEFPNEEGKPYKSSGGKIVWNEELKREIPEGWKVKTLENFGKLIMGQSPKSKSYNSNNEGLPLINGAAELQRDKIEITKYTSESTRICTKGDLIFCIRATIGNINYADKSYCLGRGVGAFHVISKEYNEYMFFVLDNILNIYNNTLTGSIIVGITKEDLLQQSMINPPKDIIMNFYNEVHFMIEKINLIKKENQELISLRDFLLPLLMNGQIGFKD